MKRIYIMAFVVVLAATQALALSVVGSKHDMIATGFGTNINGATTQVCIFCHTPHSGQVTITQAPLWNNTLSASVAAGAYYTSATINFAYDENSINLTDARLCLSCHDGTVGDPVNGANLGDIEAVPAAVMAVNAVITTNLSNDHPIGMDLTGNPGGIDKDYWNNPGMRTPAQITASFGGIEPFFGGLPNDNINIVWCSSCHDVHNNAAIPFLRIDNAGSALCKACHIK